VTTGAAHELRLVLALTAAVWSWCAAWGCAPPAEHDPDAAPEGPYPLSVDPEDGSAGVFTDKIIRVRFSDHLDERSLRSGRLSLRSGSISLWVRSFYDPVRRDLVVWSSSTMRKYATWSFGIEEGVRGLDGGEVAAGQVTSFRTGEQIGGEQPFERLNYEDHVRPIFSSSCASCHGGPGQPIAGLALDDAAGVASTLLGAPAEGWPGWKRAAPGRPGESYLLYKLIGDERIAGLRMPRSFEGSGFAPPLAAAEQEAVADWLAGGAAFF